MTCVFFFSLIFLDGRDFNQGMRIMNEQKAIRSMGSLGDL